MPPVTRRIRIDRRQPKGLRPSHLRRGKTRPPVEDTATRGGHGHPGVRGWCRRNETSGRGESGRANTAVAFTSSFRRVQLLHCDRCTLQRSLKRAAHSNVQCSDRMSPKNHAVEHAGFDRNSFFEDSACNFARRRRRTAPEYCVERPASSSTLYALSLSPRCFPFTPEATINTNATVHKQAFYIHFECSLVISVDVRSQEHDPYSRSTSLIPGR